MKTVIYVPLVNHLTRKFIAATPVGPRLATSLGATVAAPMVAPETPGPRPAILMDQPGDGLGDLVVFLRPGDPSAEAVTPATAFVGSVPYSKNKEAGTFHFEEDAEKVEFRYAKEPVVKAAVPAAKFSTMTVEQLKAHAAEHKIDLGAATKKEDIRAIIEAAV